MNYEKHTIASRNPIKRWLHRQRFDASLKLLQLESGQHFLDYGCGDGELVLQAKNYCPEIEVVAFEPAQELNEQAVKKLGGLAGISVIQNFKSDIPNIDKSGIDKFDRIACLETVEHLPEKELAELFNNIKSVLREDGLFLITFPIEHGCISLIKNLYRMLSRRDPYVSIKHILRQFLGLNVPREQQRPLSDCNYIYSHIGFDSREMIKKIREHFDIKKIAVLPTGFITCGLGNSVAVVIRQINTDEKQIHTDHGSRRN